MRKVIVFLTAAALVAPTLADGFNSLRAVGFQKVAGRDGETFFDDFESYALGSPFTPNGAWSSAYHPNTSIIAPGLVGSGQCARHSSDASGYWGNELNAVFPSTNFGVMAANLKITGAAAEGSLYQFIPAGDLYYSTRVTFETDYSITVAQLNTAQTAFDFIDTGYDYPEGQEFMLATEVLPDGTLNVYFSPGSDPLADTDLIFTGLETSAALGDPPEQTEAYATYAGNEGLGTYDIDNLTFPYTLVPEPATLALLAVSLLLRRR